MTTKRSLFVRLVPCRCLRGEEETVTTLDYSHCSLEQVPKEIFTFEKTLEELYLDANQIEELPKQLFNCQSLHKLSLPDNDLTTLPASIANLINLRELDVSKNGIQEFPENIKNCKVLTVVEASVNPISKLPDGFSQLLNLTQLYLNDAFLEFLPANFGRLTKLQILELRENQLKMLPKTMNRLTQLERLDLGSNEFTEVEGNLKRYPTPYPDELKNMVKTVQTIVHRLKDEETNEESGRDMKHEDQQVVNKDMGVKTSESTTMKSKLDEREKYINSVQKMSEPEAETSPGNLPVTANMKVSGNLKHINHDDVFEESEDLSSDEEMKMAEMRPPLIETSINQPKVVALSNNKKDDAKDADSLSDEVTHNSNQNNSNCSSPSRMSDSVSLNTDSSQDNSLCSPVKQITTGSNSKIRQEDENFNSLLQNGDILNNSEEKFKVNDKKDFKLPEYDLNIEERLVLIEKDDSKSTSDESHQLDRINMNLNKLVTNDTRQPEITDISKAQDVVLGTSFLSVHPKSEAQHTENGNKYPNLESINKINGLPEEVPQSSDRIEPQNSTSSADMGVSKSTEDLSPQRSGPVGSVMKSHSITNMETGGLKIYDILSDDDPQPPSAAVKMTSSVDGKNIVRSKSATLLYDQPLQVFTASSSSSDLMSGTKAVFKFDSNHNPEDPNIIRGPIVTGPQSTPQLYGPPQYNVQYSGSAAVKETLWHPKQNSQLDPVSFPPQRLPRSESAENHSYTKHSANMNFSNHNNVRANTAYHLHQRLAPARHGEMWAVSPNDRLIATGARTAVQQQSSVSSTASMNLGDPGLTRRAQISEGDYLSYRDLHSVGRTPVMSGSQRPLSARAYSIDGPNTSRPQSARPSINEIPERTMSVSDFNYSRTSPSKRPNARVGSEHSLLDPPGKSKVPHDWREQVLRHIEAKKLEKSMLSRSFNSTLTAVSSSHYGSSRDLHGSQGSLALSVADGRGSGGHIFRMPLSNGQMGQPLRPQANYSQIHHPPQASVARHPSREQLIDYLMLKVAHQPPYTHPHCSPRQGHELAKQEIRVRVEKDPELGFSISGGVGGRGNPFRPDDDANGYSFINIEHGQAVSLLKTFQNTVELIIVREVSS
ncbi:Protein LAP2 [Microtus ochrogaster]|uniref:Protein LAP2 n=1 Tax=Microtus ochrogaster TaxID=79684 RepID=A0A8J6L355_MICOH|nr:Protein LAP2 [Microtus ochrogaster]